MLELLPVPDDPNAADDPVPLALFEGRIPNQRDLAEIRARGLGMHFVELPQKYLDLAFLHEYSDFLEYLSIADAACRDVRPVLDLGLLRGLSLYTNQQVDVDLTQLPALESFHGQHARFESVVNCRRLRGLGLQRVNGAKLGEILGPVEYLELIDARTLRTMPTLHQPRKLKQLWILGPRDIDLTGVSRSTELREISLESCGLVTAIDELRALPNLEVVGLIGCKQIRPIEALLDLDIEHISVLGKNPFDASFRLKAADSATHWEYYGSARKPPL